MPPELKKIPDDLLVKRTKQGDAGAFGEIYDRYFTPLYRYIHYRISNRQEAEDIAETVFLNTLETILRGETDIVNIQGWLFRSAHNAIVDHYRMHKATLPLDQATDLEDGAKTTEKLVQDRLDGANLRKAIASLEPDYQQVIALRFISQLSHSETAQVMGLKEGNLRVMQYRALKRLRQILDMRERND